ncbi:pentatricopeptide repeat-containing protein At4g38010-like [Mercurialis annua]|uniref:pentatricopeptide repeat-containing protein At4g38010-like n=1 Tax=Mercurialis annua TaxID=3986 RepID=UPI00215FA67D|nr:pentatricopeptide repeat-containing protein At4g38010-like [Mercurialis annua]
MKRLTKLTQTHFSQLKTLISQNSYPQALKSSLTLTSPFNPLLTDQIYSNFIKSGNSLDPYLSSSLISHYSKINKLSEAFEFFLDTKGPDIITYNALISGFAKFSYSSDVVFELFNELRRAGLVPDVFTLSSLVKGCGDSRENEAVHGVGVRLGFECSGYVVSGLIENYAKNGDVGSSERCFSECFDVDNVVYTAMISGYVGNCEFDKGKKVFGEMRGLGLEFNEFSLTGVMGGLFDVGEGGQIHGFGLKMGLLYSSSMHLSNAVLSMYLRCGSNIDAVKVFDEIPHPDLVSWTERIAASFDGNEALECFRILLSLNLGVNEYTLINVLSAIGGDKFLIAGKQIYALCHKAGYFQAVSVGNALVSMFGRCGQLRDARQVFSNMIYRDSVSWNSLIAACSENGFVTEALQVYSHMRDLSLQPTIYTLSSILEIVSNFYCIEKAMQIHSLVIKSGFMWVDCLVSSLIITYGRCNGMDASKRIFYEINEINLVHLNAMMTAFVHGECHLEALHLFQTIWSSSLEVDGKTFSTVLKACCAMTDMEQGAAIHSLSLKYGLDQDSFIESALVDIYCKCGNLVDAEEAFFSASTGNLAAWNAMIMGYAQHGCCQDVFRIFDEMCKLGVQPDKITYLGLLTSCCHVGLVDQALYYFQSMLELHGVIPSLEHYACMVDLFGRLGLVEDAKEMIDHMPVQPDAHIWQILLSACNIHKHVELGRVAANKLLELQPENESAYVLLSNLYASNGMWGAVGRLRKEMKQKISNKGPGSSWIQVEGTTLTFFADDISHSQNEELYLELIRLYGQMLTLSKPKQDEGFQYIYAL